MWCRSVGLLLLSMVFNAWGGVLALTDNEDGRLRPMRGLATLSGTVYAPACSIALASQYQTLNLNEQPLLALRDGASLVYPFSIQLENCSLPTDRERDPAMYIRFEGTQGTQNELFLPSGGAQGIGFKIRDALDQTLHPGKKLSVHYKKQPNMDNSGHYTTLLNYSVELLPDGSALQSGDYHAILRFFMSYE
ncbi:MAG: fimbrial protein [Enterobacterales bacterium]|uniref:fimbrial protein n=1 Tax=Serratia sp. (in: enterobacteria) TaxID=616 RepID=UPI003F376283